MFSFKTASKMRFVTRLGMGLSTLAISILLLFSYYGQRVGNFTIDLNQELYLEKRMILSETIDFAERRSRLIGEPVRYVEPMGVRGDPLALPPEIVARMETFGPGSNNGINYFAYVFYAKNDGEAPLSYSLAMYVEEATRHVDEAIRVMVIHERDITGLNIREQNVYAKPQSHVGEQPGYPEPGTTMFYSSKIVFDKNRYTMNPGVIDKFTIVMWIHGEDLDCTDIGERAITEGTLRMSMRFGVLDG